MDSRILKQVWEQLNDEDKLSIEKQGSSLARLGRRASKQGSPAMMFDLQREMRVAPRRKGMYVRMVKPVNDERKLSAKWFIDVCGGAGVASLVSDDSRNQVDEGVTKQQGEMTYAAGASSSTIPHDELVEDIIETTGTLEEPDDHQMSHGFVIGSGMYILTC